MSSLPRSEGGQAEALWLCQARDVPGGLQEAEPAAEGSCWAAQRGDDEF